MHRQDHTPQAAGDAHRLRRDLTISEKTFWSGLRRSQLGWRFRRQEPIGPYIVDFVCLARHLIIEVDGVHHHTQDADYDRDQYLRGQGFRVLRFDNLDMVVGYEGALNLIRLHLDDPELTEPPLR